MAVVPQEDLYMFLVSSVRYALGRSSYIVGSTAEAVDRYWPFITPEMRSVILRDIREALGDSHRRGTTLGMEMDQNTWQGLLRKLDPESKRDG